VELAVDAVKKNDDLNKQTTPQLRDVAERQELEQRIAQARAKVAQEYAIAARIQTAAEVEMEEFYEYIGEGGVGAQGNINTGDIGLTLGGGVRRVSKRVYRFRGWQISETVDPNISVRAVADAATCVVEEGLK
jgi:hypothetical protein